MGSDLSPRSSTAVQAVSAALGTIPGIGSLVAFFGEIVLPPVIQEHERRHSVAIRAAERSSGMSREDIAETLAAHPESLPLASRVLFSIGQTNQDEMIAVLGTMLGAIAQQPDDSEMIELITMGLGDLRRAHLRVLLVLRNPPQVLSTPERHRSLVEVYEDTLAEAPLVADEAERLMDSAAWDDGAVAKVGNLRIEEAQIGLAGLVKSGFAYSPPILEGPGYLIAPAGELVIEILQRYQLDAKLTSTPVATPE